MLQVFRKNQKGFTLIELLVVIAIIGVLSTIVLVSLNTARQKARDVRRVSDMRQVALGLEMFYDDHTSMGYPGDVNETDCDDWVLMKIAIETGGYISSVPSDPGTGLYAYEAATDHQSYVLRATLEDNNNAALKDDIDAPTFGCVCTDPGYCIKP